jgi:PPOX class probable F420-dependent enzyme
MRGTLDLVRQIGADNRGLAVVATTRADGSVHASLVNAGVLDDPPSGAPVVALVARGDARKVALLRRSGRAALTFQHGWQWVSVEGPVTIIGPDEGDVRDLLRRVFRAAGGTHDDWDEFDRVMAAERRVAVLVEPARIITNG